MLNLHLSTHAVEARPVPLAGEIDAEGRQWAMLVPAGKIETKDGRGPYVLKEPQAVIAASFAAANTGSLPVDINHAIDLQAQKGGTSPAAGWITRMEARPDGIWGQIEWTANAASMIRGKEYRFLSPVFLHTVTKPHEVKRLDRVSLVNDPNLTMTALNAAEKGKPMDPSLLANLRKALNLAEDADGPAILAAVETLSTSRNSADPSKFVPIDVFQSTVAELHKLRSGVSLQAAEAIVDQAFREGKILPFMRPWALSLCQANSAAFEEFLHGAGAPVRQFVTSLHTSAVGSKQPPDAGGWPAGLGADIAKNLGHTADDIKKFGKGAE